MHSSLRTNIIVSILCVIFFIAMLFIVDQQRREGEAFLLGLAEYQRESSTGLMNRIFEDVPFKAQHIFVYDVTDERVLFARDHQTPANLASLAKIVTARAALAVPFDQEICLTREDIGAIGDSGLLVGECFGPGELVSAMLVASSNDSVAALVRSGEGQLEEAIETYVREQELPIWIQDPSGWDFKDPAQQSIGSAFAILGAMVDLYSAAPDIAGTTASASYVLGNHELPHTYPEVEDIPGIQFLKTGYTDLAGGNVAALMELEQGNQIAVVIMGSGFESRFDELLRIRSLLDTVYRFFDVL